MRISIIVKANAKQNKIDPPTGGAKLFKILVKAPAKEGKANEAVIKLLAEYFKISKLAIKIICGLKSKNKILDIDN